MYNKIRGMINMYQNYSLFYSSADNSREIICDFFFFDLRLI